MQNKIIIASAVLMNAEGDLLTVRKKNSLFYMLPGGKLNLLETPAEALIRELNEELHMTFDIRSFQPLGVHCTTAANEKNTLVEGHIFVCSERINTLVQNHAEIEEVRWLSRASYMEYKLAHLLSEYVLPKWLNGLV